jgi:hypothetical protein
MSAALDRTFVVNQPRLVLWEVVLYLLRGVSRNVPADRVNLVVQRTIFVPGGVSVVRLLRHVRGQVVQYCHPSHRLAQRKSLWTPCSF